VTSTRGQTNTSQEISADDGVTTTTSGIGSGNHITGDFSRNTTDHKTSTVTQTAELGTRTQTPPASDPTTVTTATTRHHRTGRQNTSTTTTHVYSSTEATTYPDGTDSRTVTRNSSSTENGLTNTVTGDQSATGSGLSHTTVVETGNRGLAYTLNSTTTTAT